MTRTIQLCILVIISGFLVGLIQGQDTLSLVGSTVPLNGDVNPYGVAVAQENVGNLHVGDVLISNFNDINNKQGRGTTIVRFPGGNGPVHLFATVPVNNPEVINKCNGGYGLTTALVILKGGWVIVGALPTVDGTTSTAKRGCLLVFDAHGNFLDVIEHPKMKGPWDMTFYQDGDDVQLFVSCVLNGDVFNDFNRVVSEGSIVRIKIDLTGCTTRLNVISVETIATGFAEKGDPAALIIGPTGVALKDGDLYVADSLQNRIAVIYDVLRDHDNLPLRVNDFGIAGSLNDPLGLIYSPTLYFLVADGADSNVIQILPNGQQNIRNTSAGGGGLFGLAARDSSSFFFVDDNTNTLQVYHIHT